MCLSGARKGLVRTGQMDAEDRGHTGDQTHFANLVFALEAGSKKFYGVWGLVRRGGGRSLGLGGTHRTRSEFEPETALETQLRHPIAARRPSLRQGLVTV